MSDYCTSIELKKNLHYGGANLAGTVSPSFGWANKIKRDRR